MDTMMTDCRQTLLHELEELPDEIIPNLVQVVHQFKAAMQQTQRATLELRSELSDWDRLSDEALLDFEKEL